MTMREQSVFLHLDSDAKRRLEKAAEVAQQSPTAFVEQAADERARDVLLEWAVRRYHEGDTTYSLIAEETGLPVEEIMYAMGWDGIDEALQAFLARARTLAEECENPDLLRLAHKVVALARQEIQHPREWRDHS